MVDKPFLYSHLRNRQPFVSVPGALWCCSVAAHERFKIPLQTRVNININARSSHNVPTRDMYVKIEHSNASRVFQCRIKSITKPIACRKELLRVMHLRAFQGNKKGPAWRPTLESGRRAGVLRTPRERLVEDYDVPSKRPAQAALPHRPSAGARRCGVRSAL